MSGQYTSRLYQGGSDLALMLELQKRARTRLEITEYPSPNDLREMVTRPEAAANLYLWFDELNRLAGFAWLDGYNNLRMEWDARSKPEVGELMLDWAIPAAYAWADAHGESDIPATSLRSTNKPRIALLERRGFHRLAERTVHMERPLDRPVPPPVLPPGFSLRSYAGESEIESWVAMHQAAFGTQNMTVAYRRAMSALADYLPDLDLVAVAPDGRLAAYVMGGIPASENALSGENIGHTDPVATHPDFQRLGLSTALLCEALRRLQQHGIEAARLSTGHDNQRMLAAARKVGFEITAETWWFACPERNK